MCVEHLRSRFRAPSSARQSVAIADYSMPALPTARSKAALVLKDMCVMRMIAASERVTAIRVSTESCQEVP